MFAFGLLRFAQAVPNPFLEYEQITEKAVFVSKVSKVVWVGKKS